MEKKNTPKKENVNKQINTLNELIVHHEKRLGDLDNKLKLLNAKIDKISYRMGIL